MAMMRPVGFSLPPGVPTQVVAHRAPTAQRNPRLALPPRLATTVRARDPTWQDRNPACTRPHVVQERRPFARAGVVSNVGLLRDSAQCQTSATPALALFGLGLNHDAEHALGLILRQPERLDGDEPAAAEIPSKWWNSRQYFAQAPCCR